MELAELLPRLLGIAWLLPLVPFALIVFFGPRMGKAGVLAGYVASGAILGSLILSAIAFLAWVWTFGIENPHASHHANHHGPGAFTDDWYTLGEFGSLRITISYYIDALCVCMFCTVSLIATCIHFYAMGYMHEELHGVTDHEVTLSDGEHLHRPGRYHRFFQYMSLFCFSMLGLVVAGNIAMVFVFWELVGICSYFLIGFYIERPSACDAANKAFIVNRIGDFGMIIGMMALWSSLGTFAFGDVDGRPGIFSQLRRQENHYALQPTDAMVLASAAEQVEAVRLDHALDPDPAQAQSEIHSRIGAWRAEGYGWWLLVVAGLGIFCGCVGKSAQFPLHVWLPDAMEGPTPVSALVHSATMVAAGVYLVGRFYPVFAPEVLLVIAYVGAVTLFLAATIAITATDIKRVLAYSTVSQLGYMMLALGAGGWAAGLFHLITHAFFKSLLFLCSGSVIHAVHTNEMPQMGGLLKKMPWTAGTMLVGCLAIIGAGIPFLIGFAGYYSKDAIIAQAFSFWNQNPTHGGVFFAAAAGGAAITAFYMFRLWYMTFLGQPRDRHRYDHAHESPKVMYVPLVILAVFALAIAWAPRQLVYMGIVGLVIWGLLLARTWFSGALATAAQGADTPSPAMPYIKSLACLLLAIIAGGALPKDLTVVNLLEQARPASALVEVDDMATGVLLPEVAYPAEVASHEHDIHVVATLVAFSTALGGFVLATLFYGARILNPAEAVGQFRRLHRFLLNKWYFDELYWAVFAQGVLFIGGLIARFDRLVIDGVLHRLARWTVAVSRLDDLIDRYLVDGLVNLTADWTFAVARSLRSVQTGRLRQYVLFIVVGAVALVVLIRWGAAGTP